jgi:hypothetical protein
MSRRLGGLAIGLLIVLILGAALWALNAIWPQRWTESAQTRIEASPEQVYAYLDRIDRWPSWLGWKPSDPSFVHVLGPIQKGIGASLQWNGRRSGVGTLRLSQIDSLHRVEVTLEMGHGIHAVESLVLTPHGQATLFSITADYDLGYNPWARFSHRSLRNQTSDRLRLECAQLKSMTEQDAQFAAAQKAAATDSIAHFPLDTVSTAIPMEE